jgi:hopene-associated glycosyltransferase HpnB
VPIAVVASAAALLAWIYLIGWRGGFWRTDQRLPPANAPVSWPRVVAIVPARDEAAMLARTLPTLLSQDYDGEFRVILVDDESSDGTADVAAGLDRHGRLRVISGERAPQGWAGKVWAMAQGVRAAEDADVLLFTDADIAYGPGTLTALLGAAGDRALVSQMALLRCEAPAERLLIPAFVYFFAQLYPFRQVNRPASRTAAAAGGCMLVRRDALAAAGGLEAISGARIDDVALGGLLKRAGSRCWLGFTADVTSERAYDFPQIWDMVARSAYTQLRYSPAALAGTVVGLVWLYLLPPAAALAGVALLAGGTAQAAILLTLGLAAWAIMSATYVPILRLYRLSPLRAPVLPLIAALYAAMTISSAWRHRRGRGGEWKGRVIHDHRDSAHR